MGEIVNLGKPIPTRDDFEFVSDLCRFQEQLLTEKAIRKKYRMFDDSVWQKLADDDELIRKVEEESIRRIRDGSVKKERAQQLVVKAPDVLSGILNDAGQSARHRIDSAKVLNDFAAVGPQGVPASDSRFIITINLSADNAEGTPTILHFDKSRQPDPGPAIEVDTTDVVAAIETDKKDSDGGSQGYL